MLSAIYPLLSSSTSQPEKKIWPYMDFLSSIIETYLKAIQARKFSLSYYPKSKIFLSTQHNNSGKKAWAIFIVNPPAPKPFSANQTATFGFSNQPS